MLPMRQTTFRRTQNNNKNTKKRQRPPQPCKCKVHHVLFWIGFPFVCIHVLLYKQHKRISQDFHVQQQQHRRQQQQQQQQQPISPRTDQATGAIRSKTVVEPEQHHGEAKTINTTLLQRESSLPSLPPPSDREAQSTRLPDWVTNYVTWHSEMRRQFPDEQLFDHPNAPKLLIRTCLGLCGGLNDRLGQLPWDLYLANQTNRVLLLHWHRPVPLEEFLVPPSLQYSLDWRVPRTIPNFFPPPQARTASREALRDFRNDIVDMFEGYESANPTLEFWEKDFPIALERATTGSMASHKILRHRILGHLHEDVLEKRLQELGETDMIHNTTTFGDIFRLFFELAPPLQQQIDVIYRDLQLQPGAYSAVHCRVRHPKAIVGMVKGKNGDQPADKTGLPWEGETRQFAIGTANRALECAQTLQHQSKPLHDPIYFFSDSNDLVQYMSKELYDPTFVNENAEAMTNSSTEQRALTLTRSIKVLARPSRDENAHIDRQKGREASAYYGTFIDLFLAIHARCVTYGVGYYAVFATKISHTACKLLYQEEAWGGNERKKMNAPLCHLESDS